MKRAILVIFSFIFSCFCAFHVSTSVTATTKEISSALELCETLLENGAWLDDSGTCDSYSTSQKSFETIRSLSFYEDITLKNLDMVYKGRNTPINIKRGGSITISGGKYSSPHCTIWIEYHPDAKRYASATKVEIKEGVFEANLSSAQSQSAPSPVCVLDNGEMNLEDVKEAIKNYLPAGYHFYDVETGTSFERISEEQIGKGTTGISKDPNELTDIWYLKARIVSIEEDKGEEGDEPNETEIHEDKESEEVIENPNTLDVGLLPYVVIFTISCVVLFTTVYRDNKQANTYKKHKQ